ncbi:CLUMA_CG010620, isoform A [Clunio marinus]|uniref:CLUMA_CG010620, isoform A n=1 Tax=Clunio marinus TaxID=568069 RepID=A0A1J1IAA8_9DIPT|nr:CLUMA_CG010620, isoform A [Clunio marinus]
MENLPMWEVLTISFSSMFIVAVVCYFFLVPWLRRKILKDADKESPQMFKNKAGESVVSVVTVSTASLDTPVLKEQQRNNDEENVNKLFHFLQTLTAVFSSFAHGGNDVSNAIGPLIAIWLIYTEGSVLQKSESPILLLLYGGFGMCLGLWLLGTRVNDTIGKNITKITPTTGFTVESSAASTVLLASKLGIPISSTHCIVGSVAFVGWMNAKLDAENKEKKVDWLLFRSIIFAWLITLPAAGAIIITHVQMNT